MFSKKCVADDYWNQTQKKCVPCSEKYTKRAGFEFNPNCGLSDDGGQHDHTYSPCENGKFNDGSFNRCKSCSECPLGEIKLQNCTTDKDTRCCKEGYYIEKDECKPEIQPTTTTTNTATTTTTTTTTTTVFTTKPFVETTLSTKSNISREETLAHTDASIHHNPWIGLTVATFTLLIFFCLFLIIRKRKHITCRAMKTYFCRKSLKNTETLEYSPDSTEELNDINYMLSPEILAAPLQTVLNNLDVVEELVLLLDPETPGAKNTRHLAANCSFSFSWINYAYSMKATRSPLVAVLEGVISKHPCWNVRHLAELLSNIGRNDAVAVLGKVTISTKEELF